MNKSIEQMVEELLRHPVVWEETKERLKEMLAEHQAGTLDADDARYIEGFYRKVTGREPMSSASGGKSRVTGATAATAHPMRPANDPGREMELASTKPMASPTALIAAIRTDIEGLVLPAALDNRTEDEKALRQEIAQAINEALDALAERHAARSG